MSNIDKYVDAKDSDTIVVTAWIMKLIAKPDLHPENLEQILPDAIAAIKKAKKNDDAVDAVVARIKSNNHKAVTVNDDGSIAENAINIQRRIE